MRKISQGVATKIAEDMVTKTIGKKIVQARKELKGKQELISRRTIPSEVTAFDLKFPNYCKTNSTIRCVCGELHLGNMSVESFPSDKSNYYNIIEISREEYDWFVDKFAQIETLKEEESKLEKQIYETLIHLSTPKRIQLDFPEAYELLEAIIKEEENRKCVTVALPIDEIKNSLLKYKD